MANPAVKGIDGFPVTPTRSVGGEIAPSINTTVEQRATATPHLMPYPPGSESCGVTFGLPALAITRPFGATIAQARTFPLMNLGFSLTGLIV